MIGAGSVVLQSQKPNITVFGNPARRNQIIKMYKNDRLSDFFFHNGLIIYGKKDQDIYELDYELIIQLFEKHGIILFRDFDLDGKDIKNFLIDLLIIILKILIIEESRFG